MPFRIGPLEIGLILIVILMVFGIGKLPQVGSAIGKAMRAFQQGQRGEDEEETKAATKKTKKATKNITS